MNDKPVYKAVRSYVLRQGRITPAQQKALQKHWVKYGLETAKCSDATKAFQQQAEVILEIGFGDGQSLLQMAIENPDKNFIGIEVHLPGVGRLLNAIDKLGLTNVKVLSEDAVLVLQQAIPDNSLSKIQIFFPDPWPKKRHFKRRLIQPDFVRLFHTKLKVGGLIHLATDWENYAQQMMEILSNDENFRNVAGHGQYIQNQGLRPKTKFEKRGENLGHKVWDLLFAKLL